MFNACIRVLCEQTSQIERSDVFIVSIHHKYRISTVRKIGERTNVSDNDLHANIRTNRDDIYVHQSAGAVLIVGQNSFQSLLILIIK